MKPIGYDALIKLYQEYLRIVSDEETLSFSEFAGKFSTVPENTRKTELKNQEAIIGLLVNINNNLIYLKRAAICEHFKEELK